MRIDKYSMAKGWMMQEDATPEEAKATWDTLETEFEEKRKAQLMASAETDAIIQSINDKFGPGTIFPASQASQPPMTDTQRIMEWEERNRKADGGQLVAPSGDGSRPGYSGVYERIPGSGKYRITGSRGGVNAEQWLHEHGYKTNFTNKKEAEKVNKIFNDAHPKSLVDMGKDKWMTEIETLKEEFNKIVNKDFAKQNMSKTPTWKSFLEGKKLKHGSAGMYRSQAPNFGVLDSRKMKFELADILIEQSNNSLKHTPWMDIQKKLSKMSEINTTMYRSYIDKLDSQAVKASKAFDYLLDNDIELKVPKNLSKTMAQEGSLLRKVIHDLTGVNTVGIRKGLNMNDAFNKNFDQLDFAARSNLITEGEGRTLKEIIDNADYRMKGNISWTSDIKRANRANKNVFDYALRNFNYHQLNKTGEGQIQFFDKKTNKPINWSTLPKNKNGYRTLPPNDVYFIDSTDPTSTKWDMTKIDADNMKWSKGVGSSGMFDEVFKAKDTYDKLLATKVTDPRSPKGVKISFGKLMSEVYQKGFDNFGNPYSLEHGDGIAKKPFNNIKIASQRINQALSSLNRNKNLTKSESNKILKELQKGVFNPESKNVVDNIIKSTSGLQQDVLVKGKTFDQSLINEIQDYITGKSNKSPMLSSGLSGAYDQLLNEPAIKALKNTKGYRAVAKAANVPGKFFGVGDILLGALDYENNIGKGQTEQEALKNAVQMMTFGAWKIGDKERLSNIKKLAVKNGMDGDVFDSITYMNEKTNLFQDTVNQAKFKYDDFKKHGMDADAEKIKVDAGKRLTEIMGDITTGQSSLITNVRVDEAGAPIDINVDDKMLDAYKNVRSTGVDYATDQAAKVYDKRKRYVNETSGPWGEKFLNSILTADSYKKLLPQNWLSTFNQMIPFMPYKPVTEKEKEAKRLKEMDEKELYLYNKARGMSPDQPLSGKGMLEFILQNPEIYGSPQSFFDGGIASLRRKNDKK